jgi:hypothetical protein
MRRCRHAIDWVGSADVATRCKSPQAQISAAYSTAESRDGISHLCTASCRQSLEVTLEERPPWRPTAVLQETQ